MSLLDHDTADRSRSVVVALAVAASVGIHGLVAATPLLMDAPAPKKSRLLSFKVVRSRPKPMPLPPPPAKVEAPLPPPPVRSRPRRRIATRAAPPAPVRSAPLVFGATRESVTTAGGGSFAVPLGNTVATDPANRGPVKGRVASPPPPASPAPPPPKVTMRVKPDLVHEVKVPYPSKARGLGIEGTVTVRVRVGIDGRVREARVLTGPGFGLNQAARRALLGFRFKPAIGSDGKPMPWWITYRYTFRINE